MEAVPETLDETMPLAKAADALARSPHGVLPAIAADGSYPGAATARTAAETLADGAHDSTTVAAVTHLPRPVTIGSDLSNALDALVSANGAGPRPRRRPHPPPRRDNPSIRPRRTSPRPEPGPHRRGPARYVLTNAAASHRQPD
jgi:CBS domain-containing protein